MDDTAQLQALLLAQQRVIEESNRNLDDLRKHYDQLYLMYQSLQKCQDNVDQCRECGLWYEEDELGRCTLCERLSCAACHILCHSH